MMGYMKPRRRIVGEAATGVCKATREDVCIIVGRRTILCGAVASALVWLGATTGCSEKHDQPAPLSLTGKVVAVDAKRKTISVEYDHPKLQTKQVDTAVVTEATEIQINGVMATLADVRVGEHVRGEVLVEGKSDQRKMRVLKMEIDRLPDK